jgi:hypothetical protein
MTIGSKYRNLGQRAIVTVTQLRNSRLMIAVLPDETSAFEAYQLLWRNGIPPQNLALVGKGYSNPEHVGLVEPRQIATSYARNGSLLMGMITITGLILWYFLYWLWAGSPPKLPNKEMLFPLLTVGLAVNFGFGAALGFFYGVFFMSSTSIACRNCLKRGQYLLMLEGSESLIKKAKEILWMNDFPE